APSRDPLWMLGADDTLREPEEAFASLSDEAKTDDTSRPEIDDASPNEKQVAPPLASDLQGALSWSPLGLSIPVWHGSAVVNTSGASASPMPDVVQTSDVPQPQAIQGAGQPEPSDS